jgi:HNH endonuclease
VGAAPTGGASLVATGAGAVAVVAGGTAAISGSIQAGIYLAKQLGEAGGPKVGSEGGPGAGKRFSDKTKDAARTENPNCVFCDTPTTREPGPTQSNIDHSKAKARGGNSTAENAQNTCRECNQSKGTKSSEEFLKQ